MYKGGWLGWPAPTAGVCLHAYRNDLSPRLSLPLSPRLSNTKKRCHPHVSCSPSQFSPPHGSIHALAAMANNPPASSISIRGAAAAPARVVANALRGAGISARSQGMDVDGGGARGGDRPRGIERRKRSSGPLDQVGSSCTDPGRTPLFIAMHETECSPFGPFPSHPGLSRPAAASSSHASRPAGIDRHRAGHLSTDHTAGPPLFAAQPEEAHAAVSPTQAAHRPAHPQASPPSDRHLQKPKRTTRNRNCQESCRVQR